MPVLEIVADQRAADLPVDVAAHVKHARLPVAEGMSKP